MPRCQRVSVAILSWNGRHHLEHCLPALLDQHDPGVPWEILVLDNGSVDDTKEWFETWQREEHEEGRAESSPSPSPRGPEIHLLESAVNLGFCAGNNRLVEAATGDAIVLLNNDTRPKPDWLAALVDAYRAADDDVAAVSGQIVDWEGDRLDFGRGLVTFDGHAFQWHYGRPLADADVPAAGAELPFACGGNMIVERAAYLESGGFDPAYFAYLEDVDLGWRLWIRGRRVVFAPAAVVHHRSMATSQLLGNANRGFLFERNAFATVYKNLDDALWPKLMPAVWLTLVHRTQTLLVQNNPGGDLLTLDPYAGLIANTASPGHERQAIDIEADPDEATLPSGPPPLAHSAPPRTSLAEKWRGYGPRDFVKRGVRKALRTLLPRFVFDDVGPTTHIVDPRTFAQLQAVTWILGHLGDAAERRREIQASRRRPDAEIFERFPLAIVPTYPGDEDLFASEAFQSWLPDDIPFVRHTLDDVLPTE